MDLRVQWWRREGSRPLEQGQVQGGQQGGRGASGVEADPSFSVGLAGEPKGDETVGLRDAGGDKHVGASVADGTRGQS